MQAYNSKLYWTQKGRIASARGTASCPTHGGIRLSRTHETHEEGGGAEEPAENLGTAAILPGSAADRCGAQQLAAYVSYQNKCDHAAGKSDLVAEYISQHIGIIKSN